MKKRFGDKILLVLSVLLVLGGCSAVTGTTQKETENKKEITLGFTPGPYSDQVKKGVQPALEKKGYKVKIVEFNSPNEPNPALENGSIDANIFQSTAFLNSYKEETGAKIKETFIVPSAPQGLYSYKHKSAEEVKDGMKIGIPNDPVNMERALRILEELGWIKLNPNLDLLTISEKDIIPGKYKLDFVPLESPQIPRSMDDLDYGIINGNLVIASGHSLSEAFVLENTPKQHRIVVVVREEDEKSEFVKELKSVYESREFQNMINSDNNFKDFVKPDYFAE